MSRILAKNSRCNLFSLLLGLYCFATPIVYGENEPPEIYVDEGACPFECCMYREWDVVTTTKLLEQPVCGAAPITVVYSDSRVEALTGRVETRPGKLRVRLDHEQFTAGDVIWVLTYLGEGYFKVWFDGEVFEQDLICTFQTQSENQRDCWAQFETRPESIWWVKIRDSGGTEGWTRKHQHFSNKGGCG